MKGPRGFLVVAMGLLLLLAWAAWRLAAPPGDREVRAVLSPVGMLTGADTVGYARAEEPREFRFPDDHAPHPGYRTEWWYVTGHLQAEPPDDARKFSFQLTFFRAALAPEKPDRESRWSTNQLWMGHFGLTDELAGEHWGAERLARGAAGLAGAAPGGTPGPVEASRPDGAAPLRVWVEDWSLEGAEDGSFPHRLRAQDRGREVDLILGEGKPPVLQGEDGRSRKGAERGNASYYYSLTRLPAQGTVAIDGVTFQVRGEAWMDREWSTSALSEHHVGWDWFSVQLSDGRELMFFELRRRDGQADPFDHGSLVHPDGAWETLSARDVEVTVLDHWTSPVDGAPYPSGWRLQAPDRGIDLRLDPVVRDQEMNLSFRYWEGAVRVEGAGPEGPVTGRGFVELTGYGTDGAPGIPTGDRRGGRGGA